MAEKYPNLSPYSYVGNNPLRFIDPEGEAIELLGDDKERQKSLEAYRIGAGKQGGAYLYENKVTTSDKDGNEVTKYYVGIYTNGPDGKGPAFETINDVTASLSSIIQSEKVVTFGLVSNGTTLTDDYGFKETIGPISPTSNPGVTGTYNGGQLGVFILDPSTNPGELPAYYMKQPCNVPGSVDQGILALHELGHAGHAMGVLKSPSTEDAALDLENKVRKTRDPNARIRVVH